MPDTLRPEPLTFCTDHHCKGRSPGHGPMSFPCPPLPDLNSSHTHCRVNTQAGACGCHEGPSREQSTVTYSPSRVCAFKSHLYSFSPCLCHFFICLATVSIFVPLPAILSLFFPHSTPESRVLFSSSHVSSQQKTKGEDWTGQCVEFAGESLVSVVWKRV